MVDYFEFQKENAVLFAMSPKHVLTECLSLIGLEKYELSSIELLKILLLRFIFTARTANYSIPVLYLPIAPYEYP